jgi:hypothetical protein
MPRVDWNCDRASLQSEELIVRAFLTLSRSDEGPLFLEATLMRLVGSARVGEGLFHVEDVFLFCNVIVKMCTYFYQTLDISVILTVLQRAKLHSQNLTSS